MTQLVSKLGDHSVHLILDVELFLFELNFFQVVTFRHVTATVKLFETDFVLLVLLYQTAKIWIFRHQVLLDLLVLHHHRAPPVRMENFDLFGHRSIRSRATSIRNLVLHDVGIFDRIRIIILSLSSDPEVEFQIKIDCRIVRFANF
jgi:hypothetical protein